MSDVVRKTLELQMKVTADAEAAKKNLDQIREKFGAAAAEAAKLDMMTKRFNETAGFMGRMTNSSGLARFFFGTPQANSATGEYEGRSGGLFSAKGAGVMAGIGGAAATVSNLTKAWQDLDNELLTAREKTLQFAHAIPVIGQALGGMINSIQDAVERLNDPETARRVRRMRMQNPIEMAQAEARGQAGLREFGLRREVDEAGFRAQAIGEFPMIGAQQALLRAGAGGIAGGFLGAGLDLIDPRLTAGMEGVQAAKQSLRAAELAAGASERDVNLARPGAARAMAAFRAARGESETAMQEAMGFSHRDEGARVGRERYGVLGGAFGWLAPSQLGVKDKGSNLALADSALKEQRAMHQALIAQQELEAKITGNKERQLTLIQKQHELAKAETSLMRTRVQILDEQYARSKMGERQLGLMDMVGQDALATTLERFKKFGRENVTQGELDLLMGNELTREFVGKQGELAAADSPILKRIRAITGERDAADIKAERDKLKAEVDMKIQLDEEKFAKLIAEKMKALNLKDLLGEIVKNQLEINLRRPEADAMRARVERAG